MSGPSEIWLSADEVIELTARTRWTAQCRALARMGIPFRPNDVGRPLVERSIALKSTRKPSSTKKTEPDFSSIIKAA